MAETIGSDTEDRTDPISSVGPLSEDELQSIVRDLANDCVSFVESEMSPKRALATRFYLGEPFGNEEEGRSQFVMTEVRDSISGLLPQLMRVFYGNTDRVIEFVPKSAEQVDEALQATDYVQYIVEQEQGGFGKTYSLLKDGLIRALGAVKWTWDEDKSTKAYSLRNVDYEGLVLLGGDDEVTITRVTRVGTVGPDGKPAPTARHTIPAIDTKAQTLPEPGTEFDMPAQHDQAEDTDSTHPSADRQPRPGLPDDDAEPEGDKADPKTGLFNVELTRIERDGRPVIWSLPPEEFLFSREGRDVESATFVGHRTLKTKSELVAMGIPEEDVEEHGQQDERLRQSEEEIERRRAVGWEAGVNIDPPAGDANDKVLYGEFYIKLDYDGDGVAELRRVHTLGPNYWVYSHEPVASRPFAVFCPDPEPHTMLGLSWAERTMDLQKLKSSLMRGTLDSMSASIFPRMTYLEGQVSLADMLNTEIGAPIRMRSQNAVTPLTVPFAGKEALPLMQYCDEIAERRTGQSDGTTGLDADALQSSTQEAVRAQVNSSQAQVEMLARLFAEQLYKPLFKGILRLLVENQPRPRMMRLRGKWVSVDPRSWDVDMDIQVNIALGTGNDQKKAGLYTLILAKQEEMFQKLGFGNPLVSLDQYYTTIERFLALNGEKNIAAFFSPPPKGWQPPPPPPPPEQAIAQAQMAVEQDRTQRELAIKESELQLKRQTEAFKADLDTKKMSMDFVLRRYQIDAQFKAQYSQQQLDQDSQIAETWLSAQDQAHDQALARQGQFHDQALARDQQGFEQQQAAAQAAPPQPDDSAGGSPAGGA